MREHEGPDYREQMNKNEIAVFGGGCFWCTEAVFDQLKGVVSVMPGFAGGTVPNPTYPQVCTGRTGHAEVARIEFDPAQISYRDMLEVFFATHDPTTLNRQGADVGTEYRSVIFYGSDEQKRAAEGCIAELTEAHAFHDPIVTEVQPLTAFYEAEDYHREYYRNNTFAPYCQFVIAPKLAKFRKKYSELLK
ncbi:MAG TPA: peptide-methionine (S)-S-oxide reductase MsrA [Candidatus Binataceae bacterium]|jgi:peptide-methionine (S)-S-oxide reductase|nr:peptide-methionine (S)-S-oxide reductase MsrA [Candidatus Binataceae bacterium]